VAHGLKLTAPECTCYDLSQLEAGYRASIGLEQNNLVYGRSAADALADELRSQSSGGLAPPMESGHEGRSMARLFDVGNVHLESDRRHFAGSHYNPGLRAILPTETAFDVSFPIGSEHHLYNNRWLCAYSRDKRIWDISQDLGGCSWSGPHHELAGHFRGSHHDFQDGAYWNLCRSCDFKHPDWDPPTTCPTDGCNGVSWKRCYRGQARELTIESTPALTVSNTSDDAYSFEARSYSETSPGYESSYFYPSHFAGMGYYQRSNIGECVEDADKTDDNDPKVGMSRSRWKLRGSSRVVTSCKAIAFQAAPRALQMWRVFGFLFLLAFKSSAKDDVVKLPYGGLEDRLDATVHVLTVVVFATGLGLFWASMERCTRPPRAPRPYTLGLQGPY
jgi:hypothetical protein